VRRHFQTRILAGSNRDVPGRLPARSQTGRPASRKSRITGTSPTASESESLRPDLPARPGPARPEPSLRPGIGAFGGGRRVRGGLRSAQCGMGASGAASEGVVRRGPGRSGEALVLGGGWSSWPTAREGALLYIGRGYRRVGPGVRGFSSSSSSSSSSFNTPPTSIYAAAATAVDSSPSAFLASSTAAEPKIAAAAAAGISGKLREGEQELAPAPLHGAWQWLEKRGCRRNAAAARREPARREPARRGGHPSLRPTPTPQSVRV
jgi:hypothetical protein